ncbi:hypothetical protein FRB99_005926 [Tulasnella sp. 403]|nr:hypothetical protein FRB99_005926 [Tulasnella sp. 403]
MYSQQYHYPPQSEPQHYQSYGGYQAPPASYSYPQQYTPPPPPPNPHHMSASQFRAWFSTKLADLVVNQKTIIHNLAFIANDNVNRMSEVIAGCIETHIRNAPPQIKLPAWYLLDSIAKNIGLPYTRLFAGFVVRLFLDSYYAVDLQTRSKMEEMLVTWRTGGPGGVELFGPDVQAAVERGVWNTPSTSSSARPAGLSKAQVLTELEVILAQKTRAIELNPYDEQSMGHLDTLTQLRTLVQTSVVSPEELSAIATQLRNLARSTASAAPPLPPMVPPPPVVYPPPQAPVGPPAPAPRSYDDTVNVSSTMSTVPASSASAVSGTTDISSLFRNLVKAGIVAVPVATSNSSAPAPLPSLASLSGLLGITAPTMANESGSTSLDATADAEKAYERSILSFDIPLTTAGIQIEQPQIIPLLYDQLPLQCKQCAQRFPDDGANGKKRYEDHLDLHFRQNLRHATASSSSTGVGTMGRGHTRSWLVGKQDWIHDVGQESSSQQSSDSSEKGKGRAISPSAPSAAKTSPQERHAKLLASYIVIPPGDEAKPVRCPICKEAIRSEFLEDEEEWIWRNAISAKGKVYHATCHADAISANLARLRQDGAAPSRSATPEEPDVKPGKLLSTRSPLVGVKRRSSEVEDDNDSSGPVPAAIGEASVSSRHSGDSPRPSKRVAVASS